LGYTQLSFNIQSVLNARNIIEDIQANNGRIESESSPQ